MRGEGHLSVQITIRRFQFEFSEKLHFSMDFGSEFLKKLVVIISCFAFHEISFEFRENVAKILISCFAKFSR